MINFVYVWSLLMFVIFFISVVISMILRYYEVGVLVEWLLLSMNSTMVEIFMLIDWVSVLFMGFVMIISSMVMLYSITYMSNDKSFKRFFCLVVMFVVSMLMMIISPSLISVLFGWDMLGLVSYCLVIYYQSFKAFNSGMITVLTNRIGDVGLLLSIGVVLVNGSWNIFMLEGSGSGSSIKMLFLLLLMAAITKSAQMPFSTWLPMAMAAPTPISSLVHSSTLVTAGVYLIIRFNKLIVMSGINFILLYLSLLTMIMSGVMASYEVDLKKVIALSTLSQLGLMMLLLSVGASLLGFYHLLTHAVFKSLLFLCAGVIIHFLKDTQDIRYLGGVMDVMPFVTMSMYISTLSLMGFPFLSGFYSKDLMMEVLYIFNMSWGCMLLTLVALSLTVLYSLRLCFYMCFSCSDNIKFMVFMGHESMVMNFSMNLLMFFSILVGSVLGWVFFFDVYIIYLSNSVKLMTLLFFLSGVLGWLGHLIIETYEKCIISCGSVEVFFNVSMWLLNFLHISMGGGSLFMGAYLFKSDRTWIESSESGFWVKLKLIVSSFYYAEFKMYYIMFGMLMSFFVCLLMMI